MAFKLKTRSALMRMEYYSKPASIAYAVNSLVTTADGTSTGTFIAMTSSTATVLGVLEKAIATTDSDYASVVSVPLLVDECGVWEMDVGTGTPTAGYALHYVDLADASNIDVTATSHKIVFITKFISATKVLGKIVKWAGFTVA